MSLLPAYIEDDEELMNETDEIEVPREFEIDFTTGQLTGKVVEGVEAVKVWVYLALRVARYRYQIVSWQYGNELEDLYGKGFSQEHLETEAKEMIKECLLENSYIQTVEVTDVVLVNGKIKANISITTIFDETLEIEEAA